MKRSAEDGTAGNCQIQTGPCRKRWVLALVPVIVLLLASASHLYAQPITVLFVPPYSGNTGNWSDPTAWNPYGVPNNNGSTIYAVQFAPTVNTTTTIGANQTYVVDSVAYTGDGNHYQIVDITGGSLTVNTALTSPGGGPFALTFNVGGAYAGNGSLINPGSLSVNGGTAPLTRVTVNSWGQINVGGTQYLQGVSLPGDPNCQFNYFNQIGQQVGLITSIDGGSGILNILPNAVFTMGYLQFAGNGNPGCGVVQMGSGSSLTLASTPQLTNQNQILMNNATLEMAGINVYSDGSIFGTGTLNVDTTLEELNTGNYGAVSAGWFDADSGTANLGNLNVVNNCGCGQLNILGQLLSGGNPGDQLTFSGPGGFTFSNDEIQGTVELQGSNFISGSKVWANLLLAANSTTNIYSSSLREDMVMGPGSITTLSGTNTAVDHPGVNIYLQGDAKLIIQGYAEWLTIYKSSTATVDVSANPTLVQVQYATLDPFNQNGVLSLTSGSSLSVAGDANNTGSVSIDSTSSVTASGNYNQISGTTVVNGNLSAWSVNINSGGLRGTGTVSGNVFVTGGTLKAGNSPGILTINGNLTSNGATQIVEIGGTNAADPDFTILHVNGSIFLSGNPQLYVSLINSFVPSLGQTFDIIDYSGTLYGSFGSFNSSINSSMQWAIDYSEAGHIILTVVSTTPVTPALEDITVNPAYPYIAAGATQQFLATGYYTDGSTANLTNSALWASNNTGVAIIPTLSGLATAVATGSASISATSGSMSGSATLTVTASLVSIAVTPANPSVAKGLTQQFTATGTYSDASTANLTNLVTWASATPASATINAATGLATTLATGGSTISATLNSISGSTLLTVTPPALQSIAVTPSAPSVPAGLTQQFAATGYYTDGSTANLTNSVTWSSSSLGVTISSSTGLATAVTAGAVATIGALYQSTTWTATLTVTGPVLESIAVTPANPSINTGGTQQFVATGTFSNNSTAVVTSSAVWASATTGVATIGATSGLATGVGGGTSSISAAVGPIAGSTVLTVIGPPTEVIGTTALTFGSTAGSSSVEVGYVPYAALAWTANTAASWLHLASGSTSGTGNAIVQFTYDANPNAGVRTGTIVLDSGLTLTVTQAGTNYTGVNPLTTLVPYSSTLYSPAGVAVDSSGNVYFSDDTYMTVQEWNAATQQVTTLVQAGTDFPEGVAVDSSGNLYIADSLNSAIVMWSSSTHQLTTLIARSQGLYYPLGVAVDAAGNVYIADTNDSEIKKWTASTQQLVTLASPPGYPRGVAVDGLGNVYFSTNSASVNTPVNTVAEWNAATQQVSILVSLSANTGANAIGGLAVDGSGNVYFALPNSNVVEEWNAATQQIATLASSYRSIPLALDRSGNVYVGGEDYGIAEVTPAFVGPASLSEPLSAGSDSLLPVLPATASLSGVFAPTSDQTWLTIGTISSGVIHFSFTANTLGAPRTAHITVLGQQITVAQAGLTSISVTPATPSIAKGLTQQFVATGTYSDSSTAVITNSVTWASGTAANATINASTGLATGVGVGTSSISATLGSVAGSTLLTVTSPALVSIAVTPARPSIAKGLTQQFVATGTYSDSSTAVITNSVTWASATTSNATINVSTGLATGVGVGASSISATSNSVAGSTLLTVTSATLVSIAVTPASPSVAKGLTQQFVATGTYTDASTAVITSSVTWASVTTATATINSSGGLATAVAGGTSSITATAGAITGSTVVTVTVPVPATTGLTQAAATTAIGNAGLALGSVTTAASNTINSGNVISQNPAAGTDVTLGTAVNLVVSTGSGNVAVTIASSPSGLAFTVSGTGCSPGPYTTGQTLQWSQGASCQVSFASPVSTGTGTQVAFTSWNDSNTNNPRTFVAPSSPLTYTASFQTQYQLTDSASPPAGGTVTPASGTFYPAGTQVSVQASANTGYQFANFSSGLSGSSNPQNVTMSGPMLVVGNFTALAPNLAASLGTRVDGVPVGTVRVVTLILTNTGLGAATNATIASITAISDVAGSGTVSVLSGTPVDLGTLASAASNSGAVTFTWPTAATRVKFTVNFTADGGYSGSSTITTVR